MLKLIFSITFKPILSIILPVRMSRKCVQPRFFFFQKIPFYYPARLFSKIKICSKCTDVDNVRISKGGPVFSYFYFFESVRIKG